MANPIAIAGSNVGSGSLITPGGAQGVQGIQGPTSVSADAGNIAQLGSDNLILVPQTTLWSQRLRSFNAVGNPTFEVDQANVGTLLTNPANATRIVDRWWWNKVGTMTVNTQLTAGLVNIPGTNFAIARNYVRLTLTGQEASLGANDFIAVYQTPEGSQFRELINDVHSISVLVRSSVAPLSFGIAIGDQSTSTQSLTKLATISTANTWTLLPFSNLPVFPPAGNWTTAPGTTGQILRINLAAGSSIMNSANDVWVASGGRSGAVGQDNWCAKAVNSTFDIAFCQWEPGPISTTPIDKPFVQNFEECLRYYCKTYDYTMKAGTVNDVGELSGSVISSYLPSPVRFPKPMAKSPTAVAYSPRGAGAANAIYLIVANSQYGVSSIPTSQTGILYLVLSGAPAAGDWAIWHYAADTGM